MKEPSLNMILAKHIYYTPGINAWLLKRRGEELVVITYGPQDNQTFLGAAYIEEGKATPNLYPANNLAAEEQKLWKNVENRCAAYILEEAHYEAFSKKSRPTRP